MSNLCRLTMLITSLPSYALVSSYTATYEIVKLDVRVGTIEQSFQRQNDNFYTFSSTTKPHGLGKFFIRNNRVETSTGQLNDSQVTPSSYQSTENRQTKSYELTFKTDTHTVVSKQKKEISQVQYSGHLHDSLSYQLQLSVDMNNPSLDKFDYQVHKKNKIKKISFVYVSKGILSSVLGEFTVKVLLRKSSSAGSRKQIKIWAAAELDYLPIKIINVGKNGEETVINLIQIASND
jgi:hypothetical protein